MSSASCSACVFVVRMRLAAPPRVARADRLDRRRRLGNVGDAGHRELAAALVCGVADAARRAGQDRRLWRAALILPAVILAIQLIGYIPTRDADARSLAHRSSRGHTMSRDGRRGEHADGSRTLDLLSVVAPVYNEEGADRGVLRARVRGARGLQFELVLVDDGSRDGSPQMLERLAVRTPASASSSCRATSGIRRR